MRLRFYVWLWGKANHLAAWAVNKADQHGYLEQVERDERDRT